MWLDVGLLFVDAAYGEGERRGDVVFFCCLCTIIVCCYFVENAICQTSNGHTIITHALSSKNPLNSLP